jgi:BirA family biotin operon repressor/biotin-[acetyl-CoA-carboxylase] ligase
MELPGTSLKIPSNYIFVKNTNLLLPENPIGTPFVELSEVDSSNNYAMRQVQAHLAEHGATWFAHYQNAGKGQRGKAWNAEPGQNIMMSCILQNTALSIANQYFISIIVALACFDFFNKYAITDTTIKWPNDIYWKDRKAGGILIETLIQGQEWRFAVAGMGLNINQTLFPENLKNPVSLKQITSKTFNVITLAKELCTYLDQRWIQLLEGNNKALLQEYNSHLYKLGEKVTFKKENATFEAIVEGVDENGNLLINTGKTTAVAFGAVKWIIS